MTVDQIDETVQRFAADWEAMASVDMGSSVNPIVRETRDMIRAVMDASSENGPDFSIIWNFDQHGYSFMDRTLLSYANGFESITDSSRGISILQGIVDPHMSISKRGLAGLLSYMNERGWDEYAQFARDELANSRPKGRGRKR